MKIDRLIGILSLLLQKDTVTAPELAAQFEVSRRTINRDIEDLCKAGIPIVTRQGARGGISIMENYKIEKTLLTNAEMQDILAGLRGLDSVNGTNRYSQLMEKLSAGSADFMFGSQSVLIDLSSWYKDSLGPKIEMIRNAIENCKELRFLYFSPKGEKERCIEPYYLIFRWSSWYLWGWCRSRGDFRLFKLNRMEKLA
ncbi:MAG: WYL domain-containing protein, partial [Lachnospiraceae bacterium]|nr:WYL domain-containing protein [Lachnospiraceae bacterium]